MKQYMMSACLGESEYADLTDRIETENHKNLRIFSTVALVFLSAMILISTVNALAHANLIAYTAAAVVMIIIRGLSTAPIATTLPLVYLFDAVLLGFGIVIGAVTSPTSAAGTFIALLLTVPLLFVDRPLRIMLLILCSDGIFAALVVLNNPSDIWANDPDNFCIF